MMQNRLLLTGLLFLAVVLVSCVTEGKTRKASEDADYHYILGATALKEQNPTEALKEFLQAEKYDARDPEIQAGLAQAYWDKKAFDLAEKHALNAVKLSDEPRYQNNLGALYLTMSRYDDAISAFRLAADNLLFDQPEVAWTGIGRAYSQKQDYQAAQDAYQRAIELNANYYLPLFRLGELYYNQDRPVEALDMFVRSTKLAPGFVDGHYWQGLVYMKTKETEKAKASFLEVIRLAPEGETARLAGNYLKIISK